MDWLLRIDRLTLTGAVPPETNMNAIVKTKVRVAVGSD
jgi:hypothetical protein